MAGYCDAPASFLRAHLIWEAQGGIDEGDVNDVLLRFAAADGLDVISEG